jgi:hypothetical protein
MRLGYVPRSRLLYSFFSLHLSQGRQGIPRGLASNARSDVPRQVGIKSDGSYEELFPRKRMKTLKDRQMSCPSLIAAAILQDLPKPQAEEIEI